MFNINTIMNEASVDYGYQKYEENYTLEMMNYIIEYKKEYNNAIKDLYSNVINESNVEIIHESFESFINKVKEIIKKFIAFIKSLFNRFITLLMGMVKSDKYLKSNKDKLMKFENKHEFEWDGYEFTIFDNVPLVHLAEMEFRKDFFDFDVPAKDIEVLYDEFKNTLYDGFYDKFRATVIGKDGEYIDDANFTGELFTLFRDGEDSRNKFTVDKNYISNAYDNYKNYKDIEKSINRTKTDIETNYRNIERYLDKMYKVVSKGSDNPISILVKDYDSGNETHAVLTNKQKIIFDEFIKAKSNQVIGMSTIHGIAFSSKLDAIKDRYDQDKSIMYKALFKIDGYAKEAK